MNFGFNSNVRAGEVVYHVQTEDRGPSHPFLDTIVYEAGRVIYKQSTNYKDFASTAKADDLSHQLHELLAQQHREVVAKLEAGTLLLNEHSKPQSHVTPVAADEGLDVRLRNPTNWLESGRVTLEIELRGKNSGKEAGNAEIEAFLERERERTLCSRARADATGRASLQFPMPPTAREGTALVIRATDGAAHGELRFRLVAKSRNLAHTPAK